MSVSAIETTLAESAAPATTRPSHPELVAAAAALRAHITDLLPVAEKQVDGLWRGGPEWCGRRTRLDIAQRHASDVMPALPLSAHVYVSLLRRDCEWLLEHYGQALLAAGAAR
ncbi:MULTISPECIES: DUF6415 family natural product biosynthesis protein [unclassified Streptomyces]|uniref:DUF6415 family natural product biosynthesis protein n=1 Tax=unclassified Streptomyces TaxID=2593676 RepID=UPI0038086DD4